MLLILLKLIMWAGMILQQLNTETLYSASKTWNDFQDQIRIESMIDSRLQPQGNGSQEGNLRCRVDGGIKTASPTNSRQNQHRAAERWFTGEAICGPLPPLKRFLQCFHPVHTIVSVSDWPGLVRSGQHCQGFPVALNDFLCIQMGNNVLTFSSLPCTQFGKKEPFD